MGKKSTPLFLSENPAYKALSDLFSGRVHMHTAFWLSWIVPMACYVYVNDHIPLYLDIFMLPYIALSWLGAWRATWNPPGRLWVAQIYRVVLGLFVVSFIAVVGVIAYSIWES